MFVPLAASFLWARVLVKKWTRSATAQRVRGPCPARLKLALGPGEHVASRASGSRFTGSPTIGGRLAPVADSSANSEMAARRAGRSVLTRLFAIGTVGWAALRSEQPLDQKGARS